MTALSLMRRGALCLWCLGLLPGLAQAAAASLPEHLIPSMAAREYHASQQPEGLQAPNRAQGFRTWFGGNGIELVERTREARPLLRLSLMHYGRPGRLQPNAEGVLVAVGERVERRSRALTEWYVNRPDGLEHGFDLSVPPPGDGALEFHLTSDRPAQLLAADTIVFGRGEDALHYRHLKVWDANGRILPASMHVEAPQQVLIRVDDRGARYPVTVDPLLQRTPDIVRSSAQSGAEFGIRLANAGDVNNDGIDDLVVGAFRWDDGLTDNGAAFVYLGPSYTNSTFLTVNQGSAFFGAGVGGAGDLNDDGFDDVVVGAPSFDGTAGTNSGAAFVYFGGSGAFNPVADATIVSPQGGANMGASVRGIGDVNNDGVDDLAVGVTRYNPGGRPDQGGAFIYFGGSAFDATVDAVLAIPDLSVNAGASVAGGRDVNGDGIADVVVGAPGYESGSNFIDEGAAAVFFGGTGALDTTADAILRSGRAGAAGGASVALGDVNGDGIDDVISGAPLNSSVAAGTGAVQVWHGGSGAIDTVADATLLGIQVAEDFGRSVAALEDINGDGRDELVVGAPRALNNSGLTAGKVKIYFSQPGGWPSAPTLQLESDQTDAAFGTSVATGRFNADAAADVAVGEPGRDVSPGTNNGAWSLYFGQTEDVFRNGFE